MDQFKNHSLIVNPHTFQATIFGKQKLLLFLCRHKQYPGMIEYHAAPTIKPCQLIPVDDLSKQSLDLGPKTYNFDVTIPRR